MPICAAPECLDAPEVRVHTRQRKGEEKATDLYCWDCFIALIKVTRKSGDLWNARSLTAEETK